MDTGNTFFRLVAVNWNAVYPRGYGEHYRPAYASRGELGLSPWIRGTHLAPAPSTPKNRFIPVDTGNTTDQTRHRRRGAVYPRGYGEHRKECLLLPAQRGLSPWIRGTLIIESNPPMSLRFIPVDTGNTVLPTWFRIVLAVYPRGYGEHNEEVEEGDLGNGLSPWIRGTLNYFKEVKDARRFIPVDTGNTSWVSADRTAEPVYPRGYGEHIVLYGIESKDDGLSPWIRGTL